MLVGSLTSKDQITADDRETERWIDRQMDVEIDIER